MTVPPTGVTYAVDSDSFTIPSGLTFASASTLIVGQQVSVVVVPGSVTTASGSGSSTPITAPAATTFTANSITLEPSQITGSVAAINASPIELYISAPSRTTSFPPLRRLPHRRSRRPSIITVRYDRGDNLLPTTLTPGQHFGVGGKRCGFRGRMDLLNPQRRHHHHASGRNGARPWVGNSAFLSETDDAHIPP